MQRSVDGRRWMGRSGPLHAGPSVGSTCAAPRGCYLSYYDSWDCGSAGIGQLQHVRFYRTGEWRVRLRRVASAEVVRSESLLDVGCRVVWEDALRTWRLQEV